MPVVWLAFQIARQQNRLFALWILILSSLFFYGWWEPKYLLLIVGSIVFNYSITLCLSSTGISHFHKAILLKLGISGNLILLGIFKYLMFFVETSGFLFNLEYSPINIVLPLGISFFTFQQIALLIDAHNGALSNFNFKNHTLFVVFFPQLISGPIVHFSEVIPQFSEKKKAKEGFYEDLFVGIVLITIGLSKKVLIGDEFANWSDNVFVFSTFNAHITFLEAWIGILCFTLQIYFDFSAYSDIALGVSRLFGVKLPLNFDSPYQATNISEFWRRWHITLSRFLQQYVYIPLGGNKNGNLRTCINLMAVMLLAGLWHGASWTFVVWGAVHGIMLIVHRVYRFISSDKDKEPESFVSLNFKKLFIFFLVALAWVLFRSEDFNSAISIYSAAFGFNGFSLPVHYESYLNAFPLFVDLFGISFAPVNLYGGGWQLIWIFLGCVFVLYIPNVYSVLQPLSPALNQTHNNATKTTFTLTILLKYPITIGVFLSALAFLAILKIIQGQKGEFIYFQF